MLAVLSALRAFWKRGGFLELLEEEYLELLENFNFLASKAKDCNEIEVKSFVDSLRRDYSIFVVNDGKGVANVEVF